MTGPICLDARYSTTRRVTRTPPVLRNKPEAAYRPRLRLPAGPERRGEGGLRITGYYKNDHSTGAAPPGGSGKPLVSVITVVLNGMQHLEQTIRSVLSQSYDNVEYILIDGGSTDGTLEIIRRYEHAIDYWVSEPDSGIYDAWNKGVCLAQGQWIAFLGADDSYLQDAIQAYVNLISQYSGQSPEYVSSRVSLTSDSHIMRTKGTHWKWRSFQKYMHVAHVGSFHNRALFDKYGLYDTTYKLCGDYELLLRPRQHLRAEHLQAVTAMMKRGGVTSSNPLVFRETLRAKTTSGGRNRLLSHIDLIMAVFKWKVRNWLWR